MSQDPSTPGNESADGFIGRLIEGRYQVRSRIARGGMATVYLATDLRLERRVAVKIMHPHLADDQGFAQRFLQEARSAARLAHPNVVNVFDQGEDQGTAFMVMEYLPGITLRELLKEYQRLTPTQALDILEAVLSGLAAAHDAGIVHRDIKPENVMLADDGRIKLADFGLARAASAATATGQALLGTIAYVSPELVTRGTADTRSDIYAVGVLLYEMLTGEQPYQGDTPMRIAYQHAHSTMPRPGARVAGLPAAFDQWVRVMTARDPAARPADARAMLALLRRDEATVRAHENATSVLPVSESTQVTRVLSDGLSSPGADAATQVLASPGTPGRADLTPAPAKPSGRLALALAPRRKRAVRWAAIVALLGLISAGAGWYAGFGPGSYLSIPNVTGLTPGRAEQVLKAAGFSVSAGQVNDPIVARGNVARTNPPGGTAAPPGAAISVLVSLGPAQIDFPTVAGMPEQSARDKLGSFSLGVSAAEFSASIPNGTVIRAVDPAGNTITGKYGEKAAVTLVVSLGPLPDVVGKTLDQATAMLRAAGLVVSVTGQEFSDAIAAGSIISASARVSPVAPGGTINLVVSKGPDLIAVPNVIGKRLKDAIATLEAAGFAVSHSVNQVLIPLAVVVGTDPGAGAMAKRASTIKLSASVVFG